MNGVIEIKCPCCGEIINLNDSPSKDDDIDEQELAKILNDLNIEFG
ncbi:hypothetical protein [Bacillus xiapuensis]|uniref:Lysine biosynthesis protein LysW n=1 Tax=Bacillus xiapuensis TaxID=2014075 RepID=A0ABU6N7T5_9BACI|nr:hypothetical protein [Bacillus xiapuensis]